MPQGGGLATKAIMKRVCLRLRARCRRRRLVCTLLAAGALFLLSPNGAPARTRALASLFGPAASVPGVLIPQAATTLGVPISQDAPAAGPTLPSEQPSNVKATQRAWRENAAAGNRLPAADDGGIAHIGESEPAVVHMPSPRSCVGWKQTGGCDPSGIREPSHDI